MKSFNDYYLEEFKNKLEQGDVSRYDILQMIDKGEISISAVVDMLKEYARVTSRIKELLG